MSKPGGKSFQELVRFMGQGMIVAGAMGAHSGNILNGDFSIGLSPGLYVERGEIVGHVKDAMVAGNVFDTMTRIIEMEDTLHPSYTGTFPAILFEIRVKSLQQKGYEDSRESGLTWEGSE